MAASPQEPRRQRTRSALLRAGAELMSRRPIDAIAVDDIVDAAGVAKGSFFNHFAGKDAFAAAIAGEIRADIEARVTAANEETTDPGERVGRAVSGFVQFALTEPKRARVMLRGHERAALSDHPLNRGLKSDIEQGMESKAFRHCSTQAAIAFVIGVCHAALLVVLGQRMKPDEARSFASQILIFVLTGLGIGEAHARATSERSVSSVIVGNGARRT